MSTELLPLFPLEVVLFPGMPLPLHIFEPRYKLMIGHCLERREEFGVLLARPEGPARVGCRAEILKVVKKYDDGRMDILTVGQSRFRLVETFDDLPYLQGRVELMADVEEPPDDPERAARLGTLYPEVVRALTGRTAPAPRVTSGFSLAFALAAELPLELDYKQQLLELRTEADRQQSLLERLDTWLQQLRGREKLRARAGGNGHAR